MVDRCFKAGCSAYAVDLFTNGLQARAACPEHIETILATKGWYFAGDRIKELCGFVPAVEIEVCQVDASGCTGYQVWSGERLLARDVDDGDLQSAFSQNQWEAFERGEYRFYLAPDSSLLRGANA